MGAPASLVLRLDASAVDPATVAYLRDLVDALDGKCFHLACDNQIAAAADDLFHLRPEPSLLTGVPEEVASAINALEELLRKGSPALSAYGRHVIRLKRAQLEEAVDAAMDEVMSVNDVIVDLHDALDATRARLLAAQRAKRQLIGQIAAVVYSPVVSEESRVRGAAALTSLLPRLGQAHEREAELEMASGRMISSFFALFWHLEVAKGRVEDAEAAVEAIPDLPGSWIDDVQLIREGGERFEESASVLREYMA